MTEEHKSKKAKEKKGKICAILLRGSVGAGPKIKETLKTLNLNSVNNCVLLEDTPSTKGALRVLQGYTTWGEADASLEKDIQAAGREKVPYGLHPPRGGFERKGKRNLFTSGGSLGYRGSAINSLVRRML
ncbi:TPA: uL30 family ribosomal protein [archaeon]|nr:uL30 family ribosomal protein [Candidatus Undinarchaeales archaeon SRR5007147.bin71]